VVPTRWSPVEATTGIIAMLKELCLVQDSEDPHTITIAAQDPVTTRGPDH
jgi:hypothetical protein